MNDQSHDPSKQRDFLRGLGIGLGCSAVYAAAGGGLGLAMSRLAALRGFSSILLGSLIIIGVVQFIYIGPLVARARSDGRSSEAKGLLTAAGVVALLNATCWVVVLKSF